MLEVVAELERQRMLPAIYFIFSRRGCREALQRCAYHRLDLTTEAEKREVDKVSTARLAALADPDEASLYDRMVDGDMMRRGFAVHHAGLLPYHKELVEELFQMGLIKVVFATETLSLGVNMPARGVVVSSFTKFDGVEFSTLRTGELTQLMGRAGRRGIDVIGHGVILKESDVEVGTIYEVAMGEGLVVESKFLPNYNMALSLARLYTPAEADELMARSFGQFQKRLAAGRTEERLANARVQLEDLRSTWEHPLCPISQVEEFRRLDDRLRSIRVEMRRRRREGLPAGPRRGRPRGARSRAQGFAAREMNRLKVEATSVADRQRRLTIVSCPRFSEHLAQYARIRGLEQELKDGGRSVAAQFDEYARKLRRLRHVMTETGFLAEDKPTDKGLLASRLYGENSLLVTEALWLGWFDGLRPPELCAVLVMLSAEDRGRERGPRAPRRYPTPAVGQVARLLRSLYFRFAELEKDLDEPNLRPPSHGYIDFARRWAAGESLDSIPLPPFVDVGDAIKAMKGLYSLLRQMDWALRSSRHPLHPAVRQAMEAMERDVIKRT